MTQDKKQEHTPGPWDGWHYTQISVRHFTLLGPNGEKIIKNPGGWSGTYNPEGERKIAASINGDYLKDVLGRIRTFASSQSAYEAIAKARRQS